MKNFYKPGQIMTVIAGADQEAGKVYQVGTLIGVAANTVLSGEENELALAGVYKIPNPDSVAIAQGALVGYDLANNKITAAGAGDYDIGHAFKTIAATTDDACVRLIGGGEGSAY